MLQTGTLPLGIIISLIGLAFFLVTYFTLRVVPKIRPTTPAYNKPPITPDVPAHHEAVLMVRSGGQVSYVNNQARSWFNLGEEYPNLERMARQTRPADAFLGLCAAEGQARFAVNGQWVEGTSYTFPEQDGNLLLVSIRQPEAPKPEETVGGLSAQVTQVFAEFSRSMVANLELETILQAILNSVGKLIPTDFVEVTLWEEEDQWLVPYRFVGIPGLDLHLERSDERYPFGEGYSGHVAKTRQPLLVADVEAQTELRPLINRKKYPFRSYLSAPLLVGDDLVGTLDLMSQAPNAFSENDLEMLRLISVQAAVALHNALLYHKEQRRSEELNSLANLTQAISAIRDPQELYAHLIEGITPLLDAEIVGFLIYNETAQRLEAQHPFVGVPPQFVALYQVNIPPGSPAERIWQRHQIIATNNATEDPLLVGLGLDHPARAAGIHNTLLIPLSSGGRALGYLQAANKRGQTAFNESDIRILSIVAGQAAPIIENAALVRQSIDRALRAESLRRIASLSGSSANLDEILKYSILELARLFQAEYAAIFLLDENVGELRVHPESVYGVDPQAIAELGRINANDPEFRKSITHTKSPRIIHNVDLASDIPAVYLPMIQTLDVKSTLDVPVIIRDHGIGEIILGSTTPDFFTRSDLQLATTVAGQIAVAIERVSLVSQTDVHLRRRVEQLTALTRISRELNTSVNLEHLLQRVYEEALQTTAADCGTILLFDEMEKTREAEHPAVLMHFGEDPGERRHPLEVQAVRTADPVLVADYSQISNKEDTQTRLPPHEGVLSSLIVPIGYQESVAGLIHLHSRTPGNFDDAALEITQALAVQAAIAIGNAQRYQEQVRRTELLNRQVETLSNMFAVAKDLHLGRPIEETLEDIAYAIQASTPFDVILFSIYNPQDQLLHRTSGAGLPLATMEDLKANPQPWENIQKLLLEEFRFGRSYFIPYERRPDMAYNIHTVTLEGATEANRATNDQWHPRDLLLVPLTTAEGEPLGLISVDAPRDKKRPDHASIETLEIFASQAALAIESQQQMHRLEAEIHNLSDKLAQAEEAQKLLPELREQNQAYTATLERMEQYVRRVTAGLGIVEQANRQPDRDAVFTSLGRELRERLGLDLTLVAGASPRGPQLLHTFGEIPQKVNPEALFGQRNPLRQTIQSGEILLAHNLAEDENWRQSPLLNALEAQAFISFPVRSKGNIEGAVLGISRQPLYPFTEEDNRFFKMLVRQVGAAITNLNLLAETSQRLQEVNTLLEFSQKLGGMQPANILNALLESALDVVQGAASGMVLTRDVESNALRPQTFKGYTQAESIWQVFFGLEGGLPGQVFRNGESVRLEDVDFARDYGLAMDNLLNYRDATGGKLPVSALMAPVRAGGNTLGVIILENFETRAAFDADDQALVESLARQAALTIENVRLYQAAEERAAQLQALSQVAATITSRLEPDALIDSLLDSLAPVVPYNTGTLWLRAGDTLTIQSARGFENSEDLVGITTQVEDSRLFYEMIQTRQPIAVGDVRADERFPETAVERLSWLGVPLLAQDEVIGVIALEKTEPDFYTPALIQSATTFASQAAVALENATLYQQSLQRTEELDKRSQRLALLNRFSNQISRSLDFSTLLNVTIEELQHAFPGTTVSAVTLKNGNPILQAETLQSDLSLPQGLPQTPVFDYLQESLGIFSTQEALSDAQLRPLREHLLRHETQALLVLPLNVGEEFFGFILVHSPQKRRFTSEEIELGRILTNQAAVAIQNASLFAETRRLTEDLERRVAERTEELGREHHRTQTLLRIMQELSASLDLDHVLNRTLALLNETTGAEQSTILLVRPEANTFYYRAALGYTNPPPVGGRASAISLNEGLAGWIIKRHEVALINDLLNDPRWIPPKDGISEHRSALAAPLMIGAEALGAMLLFSREPDAFSPEQRELVQAAANQIAVAINNNELFTLIREQAESLGSMLRQQQVEASRSRAILEAVADGVLVTDNRNIITLFNESAQEILGLGSEAIVGQSLDTFTGIFGSAAHDWMDTIQQWAHDPKSFEGGDTYAERITLDNKRVVSIHLAPVVMGNEFLGTVSIFRDITHQVEVDRLKSEFVATVSHELRTPMTSIKGYVEVLLMGAAGPLNEQQTSFLQVVKTNTERLNILVNDLLDVSRIEAGKVTLSIQMLDLAEIAQEVMQEQQRQSAEDGRPMTITLEVEPDLPRVPGDLERIHQVFANLVSNAYHYTPTGGQIDIRLYRVNGAVQIDIKDNGIGISPEDAQRIFERFYRGEDPLVLATPGNGLGLSITRQLVEMHHGRIWMESNGVPGDGSVFHVVLPLNTPEEENNKSTSQEDGDILY